MKVKLVTVDPWKPALNFVAESWPVVIGGNGDCQIVLSDRWVSIHHCEIALTDGRLVVRDLKSKGGTLVNGEQIDTAPLLPGDILMVGIRAFLVSYRRPSTSRRRRKRTSSIDNKESTDRTIVEAPP